MQPRAIVAAAVLVVAGANGARYLAKQEAAQSEIDEPWAPSTTAAPAVTVGYRELGADLMFLRLIGYFGGRKYTAHGVASLVEAIVAMDPNYKKIYTWGANAMLFSARTLKNYNDFVWRALRILEQGIERFPSDYKIPQLAGELYLVELQTKDPDERRKWDEHAARLLESAVRKPDAPPEVAVNAVALRSRLGQRQRAIDNLKEMILVTDDAQARKALFEKLAELEEADADVVAAELLEARKRFTDTWQRERPALPPSLYVLVGAPVEKSFDLRTLATGGRDLVGGDSFERLAPPTD